MPSTSHVHHSIDANDDVLAPAPSSPASRSEDLTYDAWFAEGYPEACAESYAAARQDVPMLRDEVHLPGVRRETFAPEILFTLNTVPRDDVDPFDDTLFLVEEPLKRIAKDGIHLGGQTFFTERLQSLVTGPKGTVRRKLVLQYNAAHLARGVLEEVRVSERDSAGRLVELCRCPTREEYLTSTDPKHRVQRRVAYQRGLTAGVALAQGQLTEVRSGTEARERREDEHAAREVRRRGMQFTPRVAEPQEATDPRDAARSTAREARQRVTSMSEKLGPAARGQAVQKVAADVAASVPGGDLASAAREDGVVSGVRASDQTAASAGSLRPRPTRAPRSPRPTSGFSTAHTSTPDPLPDGPTGPLTLREVEGAEGSPPARAAADPQALDAPVRPASPATRQARLGAMLGGRTGFARPPAPSTDR